MSTDRLYFRQLLSGRDFAVGDPIATQMVNFVYLVGDRQSGECVVIDPAYDVASILDVARGDDMRITGALATHFHPDHVGGDLFGHNIQGIRELLELEGMKVHVQRDEVPWLLQTTGVSASDLEAHDSGDTIEIGGIPLTFIHTPGHTPGSQCFFVDGRLVAGDTLFLQGCGRTDLPGGDPRQLYLSLTQRLAEIPDDAVLFPGHLYSEDASALLGDTRRLNYVFKPRNEAEWLAAFGH